MSLIIMSHEVMLRFLSSSGTVFESIRSESRQSGSRRGKRDKFRRKNREGG